MTKDTRLTNDSEGRAESAIRATSVIKGRDGKKVRVDASLLNHWDKDPHRVNGKNQIGLAPGDRRARLRHFGEAVRAIKNADEVWHTAGHQKMYLKVSADSQGRSKYITAFVRRDGRLRTYHADLDPNKVDRKRLGKLSFPEP